MIQQEMEWTNKNFVFQKENKIEVEEKDIKDTSLKMTENFLFKAQFSAS